MAVRRTSKGRVFISHSSLDKEFVRRLNSSLEEAGFKTWLDEKRLRVGDQIAKEISVAIAEAGALIVVVSRNSTKSDWLIYEINLATERAIKGELRILPALVDTDDLPPELKGRLYADFRSSFDEGLKSVVASLKGDRRVARKKRAPEKAPS